MMPGRTAGPTGAALGTLALHMHPRLLPALPVPSCCEMVEYRVRRVREKEEEGKKAVGVSAESPREWESAKKSNKLHESGSKQRRKVRSSK